MTIYIKNVHLSSFNLFEPAPKFSFTYYKAAIYKHTIFSGHFST